MPSVSVLVPTFNAEATVLRALQSLCRQTHSDWECVISDDGSTDRTIELVTEYARREPRITLLRGVHLGIVASLNRGIQYCQADYVARFDADDLMHRERLHLQLQALQHGSELSGVGCGVRMFPRQILTDGRKAYEAWINQIVDERTVFRDRFIECPLAHPSLLIRTDVLKSFQYRDMGWAEDYDLVLRLLSAGQRLSTVSQRLLFWRERPERLSRTSNVYSLQQFIQCKAHFLARAWLRNSDRYVLWGYGSTGRLLARALLRHGKQPSLIVELHPGRIGQCIMSAPVISPSELLRLKPQSERIVISVAGALPRSEARRRALAMGLNEGADFVCAA
jgi:glycosyltransferase involved in cell wall biosynthesis